MKPILGITMGDPTGIGPELILEALTQPYIQKNCLPLVFGDTRYLRETQNYFIRKRIIKNKNIVSVSLDQSRHQLKDVLAQRTGIYVVDYPGIPTNQKLIFGRPTHWGGKASGNFIAGAIDAAMKGIINGIVTCPINKVAFEMGGWGEAFTGHTEMLSGLTNSPNVALMMLVENFRVVHVSSHIPLSQAAHRVKKTTVLKTILLAHQGCRRLGITKPKIGVSGLNPHAGENGILGCEEKNEIIPAIKGAQKRNMNVTGPFPPDILWPLVRSKVFDVGIAMYHDQGQIPLKLLAAQTEKSAFCPGPLVNITLGIPIIRTSVGHGTAYDIAGKGIADTTSLREALKIGVLMASNRSA